MRVPEYLLDQHVTFQTVFHPPAFTSQKRARFLHISGRQVVKCVLLASGKGFILAVLRAVDHVDLAALAKTLGMNVRLASDDELAEQFGDCEPGALAPFGSLYGLRTFLDASIQPEQVILFEAQRHAVAIRMKCADFEKLEKPTRHPFAVRHA